MDTLSLLLALEWHIQVKWERVAMQKLSNEQMLIEDNIRAGSGSFHLQQTKLVALLNCESRWTSLNAPHKERVEADISSQQDWGEI